MITEPRVIFFSVRSTQEKVDRIVQTALSHFRRKEHLLFFAEDDRALHFIDDLLWSHPREGFLPHAIDPKKEWIGITKQKTLPPDVKYAFNLCPTPLLLEVPLVYDFEDLTSPQKQLLSHMRFEAYKQKRVAVQMGDSA
jgi:DNA polymerase IIIc chi subunit